MDPALYFDRHAFSRFTDTQSNLGGPRMNAKALFKNSQYQLHLEGSVSKAKPAPNITFRDTDHPHSVTVTNRVGTPNRETPSPSPEVPEVDTSSLDIQSRFVNALRTQKYSNARSQPSSILSCPFGHSRRHFQDFEDLLSHTRAEHTSETLNMNEYEIRMKVQTALVRLKGSIFSPDLSALSLEPGKEQQPSSTFRKKRRAESDIAARRTKEGQGLAPPAALSHEKDDGGEYGGLSYKHPFYNSTYHTNYIGDLGIPRPLASDISVPFDAESRLRYGLDATVDRSESNAKSRNTGSSKLLLNARAGSKIEGRFFCVSFT